MVLPVDRRLMLTRSKDRKVTNAVNASGKTAVIANAFGLPAGTDYSCPGATTFCNGICYAGKLEKIYTGVKNVLVRNYQELLYADYLYGITGMHFLLSNMVREFVKECDKRGAVKRFRIHWDGDFFSADYAKAWADVVEYYPDVQFWVYTRSFEFVPFLTGIPNLTVYLSADVVNIEAAKECQSANPGVFIAYVADTFADAREGLDSAGKVYPCPENAKRLPLITDKGSACNRCGICI